MTQILLRHAVIARLALVPVLPRALHAAEPDATAALSPPSNPSGDRAITENNLAQRVELYAEEPGNPQGTPAVGSVVWSTELSHGAGKG
jgi:hypothetical protein